MGVYVSGYVLLVRFRNLIGFVFRTVLSCLIKGPAKLIINRKKPTPKIPIRIVTSPILIMVQDEITLKINNKTLINIIIPAAVNNYEIILE